MAKKSAIERNKKRARMAERYAERRAALRETVRDRDLSPEERFQAQLKFNELPRNSAKNRVVLRCDLTGRSRGNYRKFRLCRIALRDLASIGQIPGMVKSSW
ncbi:MAG: 30S ribosomal protein S14 [Acetobacterales bacterium]